GSIPDFGSNKPGYALGGVVGGGPAEKGGLKGGDNIIQLGPNKITNLDDFDAALRRFAPGDVVDVTVERGNDKVVVKVTLDKPR
ncbi:MAG: PDZ domain-containing protein, partial [Planctomycetota bacterium]|nr:PDZ domain-containing protein [Planctomycetota bacterium]